ncbi:hypothetical protein J2W48_002913 [Flavobacterium piscis]|uniref:AAA-ATPase-like domain-containing protein n=1 Tax=Flavobacterium piscis TaxID=1114874 RepID=A0ABU1Y9Q4_9FLAO|nr:hypothetical protein [Flavobacterium piscis]
MKEGYVIRDQPDRADLHNVSAELYSVPTRYGKQSMLNCLILMS